MDHYEGGNDGMVRRFTSPLAADLGRHRRDARARACPEDEIFYVLDGEITFQRGNERIDARAGDSVFMPRGVQHGFAVRTETASLLQVFTPGGLEEAFLSLSEPAPVDELPPAPEGPPPAEAVEAMTARFAEYGVDFTGPPLPALLAA
jgi:quercetin dioxygenase-like cupin family protein